MIKVIMTEIFKNCKGYTLKLTHPLIKKDHEYHIMAFRKLKGKYGDFYMLYCYIPSINKYQRIFSNTKITNELEECMPFWTRYEPKDGNGDIMVWNSNSNEIFKFYPGEIGEYNGNQFRKLIFDFSEV